MLLHIIPENILFCAVFSKQAFLVEAIRVQQKLVLRTIRDA
jgi:hypothetical protein